MSVSYDYLQHCSVHTGYGIGPLEKVIRLGEIAADIMRHPFLGNVLALKGGTALNLCLGPPQRLSVDLDFNYIGQLEREKMLSDRPTVEDVLIQLCGRMGYRVQRSADAFAGRKLFLIYQSATGQSDRIEVDLNFLFRMPIAGTIQRTMWQPGKLEQPKVTVVSLQELLVGKLLAYLDRSAARDVWDLAYLPIQLSAIIDTKRFRTWFIAFSAILKHPLTAYKRERIEKRVTNVMISEQLVPMLMGSPSLQSIDLVKRSWNMISSIMELDADEQEYIAAIQRGELDLGLLYNDDSKEKQRLGAHPALMWKMVNVRKHLSQA